MLESGTKYLGCLFNRSGGLGYMKLLRKRSCTLLFKSDLQRSSTNEAFDDAPYGIAIVNSVSGRITRANDAYCALLGRTRERIVGQTWMRFTHLDDVARDVYVIHHMYETKSPRAYSRKRYIASDGVVVPVDVIVAPLGEGNFGRIHSVTVRKV